MNILRWNGPRGYDFPGVALSRALETPHLKFDVGSVTQIGGIEWLAERIGWDRLVLDQPDRPAHYLAFAAGMPGIGLPPHYASLISRPKIDTHWHTGKWGICTEPRTDLCILGADIRKFGIKIAITSSIVALDGDLIEGNHQTGTFCELDKNVRGMVVVNPERTEQSILEIEKYRRSFVGLKTIQDEFEGGLMHPGYGKIIREAPEDWPVMAHLPGLAELASLMPERKFVAAHSIWGWEPLAGLPNVYFDIATSARHPLSDLIRKCPDRVLFSSDAPLISPAFTLGKLAEIFPNIGLDDIFFRNALKVFPRIQVDPLVFEKPPA